MVLLCLIPNVLTAMFSLGQTWDDIKLILTLIFGANCTIKHTLLIQCLSESHHILECAIYSAYIILSYHSVSIFGKFNECNVSHTLLASKIVYWECLINSQCITLPSVHLILLRSQTCFDLKH